MHVLPESEWRRRRAEHAERLRPWAEERVRRAERGVKHPVWDFLFEYYSLRPGHLLRWSPGAAVGLEGATAKDVDWPQFAVTPRGMAIPTEAFPAHRRAYLEWAVAYLDTVAAREPQFGCFGLHEWAMVYRTADVRHRVPLRLSAAGTDQVIVSSQLRCTHYDAFRFFTPPAMPLNRTLLTRPDSIDHDQPGCVHANMDLYKFAYKLAPFISAEVLAEAFLLALQARELDMRASPYDLRSHGFEPIRIETRDGREEYVRRQREIAELATQVRTRLRAEYRRVWELTGGTVERQQHDEPLPGPEARS
jgi:hypothetical protein